MIRRFYVHNFRCLENFNLQISDAQSVLLIGKNGSGKSTVAQALEILQKIARGTNRVSELLQSHHFSRQRTDVPIRIEIEASIFVSEFKYKVAFEYPQGFKELRVLSEELVVDDLVIYRREGAQVFLSRTGHQNEAKFKLDWHLVALPIIQAETEQAPLSRFKLWLARMLIIRPIPQLILGESKTETLQPNVQLTDFGAWFTGLLAHAPASYTAIDSYLKQVMPDLKDIKNPVTGTDARNLIIQFSRDSGNLSVAFEDLSDGEKCFIICSLVLSANVAYGPLVCFWDEPDNYLDLSEVGHFVLALRKAFALSGQFIATSHNPEAIRRFSEENTFLLFRRSHLEPTQVRLLSEMQIHGDLISALTRGDVEP